MTNTGNIFVAKTPEVSNYDLDGNLTGDGRWTYVWDGENRLVSMKSFDNAPVASKYWLEFAYDYQGRRIQKSVSTNTSSRWVTASMVKYVYDGWTLIGVLNPSFQLTSSFAWGLDLSGSVQGAGGVGGLLWVYDAATMGQPSTHFVAFDGNGNVTALIRATDKTTSARYEYEPFGQTLRATGPLAKANPFRFSTKFADEESGLVYYGYRYYNPTLGRWISRDPAQENGGRLLYHFNYNNGISRFDTLGDMSHKEYDLGNGWTGYVDTFNSPNAGFELHVVNPGGIEIGAVGPEGWIAKHEKGVNPEIPDDIYRVIKGVAVNTARDAGMIQKGASIRNWLLNGTMGAINRSGKIGGAIVAAVAINQAVEGGLQAAQDAQAYARDAQGGGNEWSDFDAINVAIDVQNATGNYFMTYETLDILLQ